MSVQKEENKKNGCNSSGLGIAAAALGVGVGAALYYYFNKRNENPDREGATTSGWTYDETETYADMDVDNDSDEYTTVSEGSTSDTSIWDNSVQYLITGNSDAEDSFRSADTPNSNSTFDVDRDDSDSLPDSDSLIDSEISEFNEMLDLYNSDNSSIMEIEDLNDSCSLDVVVLSSGNNTVETLDSSVDEEWNVTDNSLDVPSYESNPTLPNVFRSLAGLIVSPRNRRIVAGKEHVGELRQEKFRQRTWSLEECSICCDVMLKDQDLKSLPCSHMFHSDCIVPWLALNDQQTCPNCRKAI